MGLPPLIRGRARLVQLCPPSAVTRNSVPQESVSRESVHVCTIRYPCVWSMKLAFNNSTVGVGSVGGADSAAALGS
jgi:hypothetical protein